MRWWQAKKRDEDLVRELQSDLDLEEEEQRERGLSPEEARYAARRAFGNSTLIREQTRAVWNWNWLEQLVRELKYGTRTGLYGVLSYLVTQGCKGQNQIGHEALTGRGLAENLVHPAPRRIPRFRPDIHFCRRPAGRDAYGPAHLEPVPAPFCWGSLYRWQADLSRHDANYRHSRLNWLSDVKDRVADFTIKLRL